MKYVNCPHCRMSNRESESNCYNCEKALDLEPEFDPQEAPKLHGGPPPDSGRGGRFVKPIDRSSTVLQGLRSGAVAGLAWGVFTAGAKTAVGGTLIIGAVADNMGGFVGGMLGVFLVLLFFDVTYGAVMGAILGASGTLCYQHDAAKWGGVIGGLWGLSQGSLISFWWWYAPLGAAAGAFISYVERSWFRKQHAEMI